MNLTIVIPTKDRAKIAEDFSRFFYKDKDYGVLWLDGSEEVTESFFLNQGNRYIWTGDSYIERLMSTEGYVSTDYVVMIGDDEAHFSEALLESIRIMEDNLNVVACSGWPVTMNICKSSAGKRFVGPLVRGPYIFESDVYDETDLRVRLAAQVENSCPRLIYSVVRRKVWNDAWKMVKRGCSTLAARGLHEILFEYYVLSAGEVRLIDKPMWFRHKLIENSDSSDSKDSFLNNKNKYFFEAWNSLGSEDRRRFVEVVEERISMKSEMLWYLDSLCAKSMNASRKIITPTQKGGKRRKILSVARNLLFRRRAVLSRKSRTELETVIGVLEA